VTAEVYRLISSPTLPAIPLLTACGYVLAESQASLRLLRFFKSLLGWMPGGLAVIVIAVCALFTTFTGGSGITVIAVGGPRAADAEGRRLPRGLLARARHRGGSLGLLFPPSLPVILYSVVAGTREHNVPADQLFLRASARDPDDRDGRRLRGPRGPQAAAAAPAVRAREVLDATGPPSGSSRSRCS
jgi:TRAP-type C4-dicarboxylate transport system permease large subunit